MSLDGSSQLSISLPGIEQLIEHLLHACQDAYGENLVSFCVFGSVARGVATPESDLDLFIVARNLPRGRLSRSENFERIEQNALAAMAHPPPPTPVSPIIKTPEEVAFGSPLLWDMTENRLIRYDRDRFLWQTLEKVKLRLQQLGAYKVQRGSAWYWILKPDFKPGEVFEL